MHVADWVYIKKRTCLFVFHPRYKSSMECNIVFRPSAMHGSRWQYMQTTQLVATFPSLPSFGVSSFTFSVLIFSFDLDFMSSRNRRSDQKLFSVAHIIKLYRFVFLQPTYKREGDLKELVSINISLWLHNISKYIPNTSGTLKNCTKKNASLPIFYVQISTSIFFCWRGSRYFRKFGRYVGFTSNTVGKCLFFAISWWFIINNKVTFCLYLDNNLYMIEISVSQLFFDVCFSTLTKWYFARTRQYIKTVPFFYEILIFLGYFGYKHFSSLVRWVRVQFLHYYKTRDLELCNHIKYTDIMPHFDIIIAQQKLFKFQTFDNFCALHSYRRRWVYF